MGFQMKQLSYQNKFYVRKYITVLEYLQYSRAFLQIVKPLAFKEMNHVITMGCICNGLPKGVPGGMVPCHCLASENVMESLSCLFRTSCWLWFRGWRSPLHAVVILICRGGKTWNARWKCVLLRLIETDIEFQFYYYSFAFRFSEWSGGRQGGSSQEGFTDEGREM